MTKLIIYKIYIKVFYTLIKFLLSMTWYKLKKLMLRILNKKLIINIDLKIYSHLKWILVFLISTKAKRLMEEMHISKCFQCSKSKTLSIGCNSWSNIQYYKIGDRQGLKLLSLELVLGIKICNKLGTFSHNNFFNFVITTINLFGIIVWNENKMSHQPILNLIHIRNIPYNNLLIMKKNKKLIIKYFKFWIRLLN